MSKDENINKIKPLVGIRHLERFFNVTRVTIYSWVKDHGLPAVRLPNGRLKFSVDAVNDWLRTLRSDIEEEE